MSGTSIGIDVGGTFTDLVAVDATGAATTRKVLSTRGDESVGVMAALDALDGGGAGAERIVHGTTVATNALLERSGARVALCVSDAVDDILELRRQQRASLYDLSLHHPPPLVAREQCVPVPERMARDGVLRALDPADATRVARDTLALEPETVAVTLLHSYRDPSHELLLARALRELDPAIPVVLSSEILPEIREYERATTTVAEAYLRPGVAGYLSRLERCVAGRGAAPLSVMTSSGGMLPVREAAVRATSLTLSGPAGGVVGAGYVARLLGIRDALTIDIGGTSADAGLILGGEPLMASGTEVAGVPIALPRVFVETVSAGGGSVGWVDDGGALRVGPRSAGALPGPAAFGRGGTEATVTDAHLVLGNVRGQRLSGGVEPRVELAAAAVDRLAGRLGRDRESVASAMLRAADAAIARALRRVSTERGILPRRCTLVAFGGGGPLHACALAEQLGIRSVLVPPLAGVLSALGLALAAERREALVSVMRRAADLAREDVGAIVGRLDHLLDDRAAPGRRYHVRARYEGQGHEMDVPLVNGDDGDSIAERFAAAHQTRFRFRLDSAVEVIGARLVTTGVAREAKLARAGSARWGADMVDDGSPLEQTVRGGAVIALPDATLLVADGWTARSLPIGGWMLERDA
jgi:N-methylhydantoinase A